MMSELRIAPAPLFKCPIGDSPAHPRLIWNRQEKAWYLFYQQRMKNSLLDGKKDALSFIFGTDIGIASSSDNGQTWLYRGVPEGLNFEPGRNTFSFPEVLYHDGIYHLYCTYHTGFPTDIIGPSQIVHYTSKDLWHWKFDDYIKYDDHRKNSMFIYRVPSGKWRMYYNDNPEYLFKSNKFNSIMESDDLYHWTYVGRGVDVEHNSVNVFKLGGKYWQTLDTYTGFAVLKSDDCDNWEEQDYKLFGEVGTRPDDGADPHHSGVVVLQDKVYLFYYTHCERINVQPIGDHSAEHRCHAEVNLRRAVIQVAEITERDGRLIGKRNEPFDFYLPNMG